jgi:putative transposase
MQQIREAFPWDQGCRYLLRDRDAIYGDDWVEMTKGLGIEEVITPPRSPWQNPFVERFDRFRSPGMLGPHHRME